MKMPLFDKIDEETQIIKFSAVPPMPIQPDLFRYQDSGVRISGSQGDLASIHAPRARKPSQVLRLDLARSGPHASIDLSEVDLGSQGHDASWIDRAVALVIMTFDMN
jgi:lysyl-tRNA synthetase class I